MSQKTQITVIGGGPGGYVAAIRAAQLGADVTLIERSRVGGTCLNAGCIPTKALLASAHLLDDIRKGAAMGVTAEPKFDFTQVQKHKDSIVHRLVRGVESLLKANGVTLLNGTASFEDEKTISVTGDAAGSDKKTLTPDKVIIASGSKPAKLPIPGIDTARCVDSTGALKFENPPKSMLVIGGGVIGVELASLYNSFGTKVTVVEMEPEILPLMDSEVSSMLRSMLNAKGIDILVSSRVESIEERNDSASVTVSSGDKTLVFEAERVLVSIGRVTDVESLSLDAAGITNDRGRITVDSHLRTNRPNIYAIGDCLGRTMLAHVASAQGEAAAEHAMGLDAAYDGGTNPSCVYTSPEFASVGLTEQEAKKRGLAYRVGRFPMAANGRALIADGGEGIVKIIADEKYGEILGLHILGANATEMIAEGALAIRLEATLDEIAETIHAHPTITEAVREAALAAKKRAIHIPNR